MSSSAAACAENLSLVPPGKMTLEGSERTCKYRVYCLGAGGSVNILIIPIIQEMNPLAPMHDKDFLTHGVILE